MRLSTVGSVLAAGLAVHAAVNARRLRQPPPPEQLREGPAERVSVLVPARDEARRIGPCLRALVADDTADEILVLDDLSRDATAAVARAAAGGDPRVRVLAGAPPPAGWLGKPHACAQLASAASGDVLVFVDADVVVAPGGLAAAVALRRTAGLALVSPYPRQELGSVAERVVQPLLQWSWLTFLPLGLVERSGFPSLVAANGQLLVCDAASYRAAGGHDAVRAAVLEDIALARAVKRAGLRATVADGTALATCRMYDGWPALADGYSKSLWAAFGSPAGAVGVAALLGLAYLLPPAAAVVALARGRPRAAAVPALGYAAGVAGRLVAARRTGGRPGDAAAHPLSIAVLLGLLARSLRRRAAGTLTWRGRPVG